MHDLEKMAQEDKVVVHAHPMMSHTFPSCLYPMVIASVPVQPA